METFNTIWNQAFIFITYLIIFRVMEFIPAGIVLKKHWRG